MFHELILILILLNIVACLIYFFLRRFYRLKKWIRASEKLFQILLILAFILLLSVVSTLSIKLEIE